MAHGRIELYRDILHAGPAEGLGGLLDALPLTAHRVQRTGEEQNRQLLLHPGEILRLLVVGHAAEHLAVELDGGIEAAEGIGHILIHRGRVRGDPVKRRSIGRKSLVVRAEGQLLQQTAGLPLPQMQCLGPTDRPSRGQNRRVLPACAGQNHPGQIVVEGIEIGPHQEGAHTVAQDKVGQIGKRAAGFDVELMHTPHRSLPAAGQIAQSLAGGHRFPVTGMVLSDDDIAPVGQKTGKAVIAGDMLRHAVDQLHNADGLASRFPLAAVQKLRLTVL